MKLTTLTWFVLAASLLSCAGPVPSATPAVSASPTLAASIPLPTPTATAPAATATPAEASPSDGVPGTPRPTLEPVPTPGEGTFMPLIVEEFGYTAVTSDGNDYATYGAVFSNPNSEWAIYRMLVQVNFFDANDTFIAGEELPVTILPGQTTALAGQIYGAGQAARLVVAPPDDPTPYVPLNSSGTIEVGDVATTPSDALLLTSGTLTSSLTTDQELLQLFAVYRSEAGDIVGGIPGAVESIATGSTVPFEFVDAQPPPAVAATDVYWQLGGSLP